MKPHTGPRPNFASILENALGSKKTLECQVTLHLGPANSGKTYDSVQALKFSSSGVYLAPLRLLAWEVADKLKSEGHLCSLLTGEEKLMIPDAPFLSSTVEMFNPDNYAECIILDEAQMIADDQRGWAWMRVLAQAQAKRLEIIASPDAEKLLLKILHKLGYTVKVARHERLAPLTVADKPWRIDRPEEHTIFVSFSRGGVLSLKTFFERRGWSVAAIYGNLPPEVKRKQAERFLSGEAKLCVATDAIGMGMNLPASKVCFTSMSKYDGQSQRDLTPAEARQIAGRAGRFGVKESGEAGALTREDVELLRVLLQVKPADLEYARISPELEDLAHLRGPLSHRLEVWEKQKAIPEGLKDVILPSDLEHQKTLAALMKEKDVEQLGLDAAFTLIKAPASRETFGYWWACVQSILSGKPFPVPVALAHGQAIRSDDPLLNSENVVGQCDVYLWLSNRAELAQFGKEKEKVLEYKWKLIEHIDATLASQSDMSRKCRKCFRKLPAVHDFGVCQNCFQQGRRRHFARPKHKKFRFR